ncbi:MAG TPA: alpha/beta hydrolase domain-containing protein, partial [Myxococcales bacterium]|nr:alpha/beta hydrolase domain-containing protein [Myxococcales bacterium]
MERAARVGFALLALALVPRAGEARVVAFVVESRQPFVGGAAWGSVGPYERLTGTAYMEADPRDPLNAVIVDIDKAPKNARGMVEFSTPFVIAKPVDMARGNHKIFYGINNRGNNPFSLLTATTQAQLAAFDVYFTMGYTLVDAGWEGDAVQTATNLTANLPIARQPDGSSIVGWMRVEYTDRNLPLAGTFTLTLEGNASFHSYETADPDPSHSILTVRDDVDSPKVAIGSDRWAFGKCPSGAASLTPSTFDICYFDGFRNDKVYELIYPAKNPIVMGLGHATTRDVGSFLRYQAKDDAGNANPLGSGIRRSYATGASQTGGYLRDFVYFGFNEDESHRRVFDGVMPTIAGTDRAFINVRFADPNIWSDQDDRHDFLQSSYPPLTYAVTTDPVSGIRAGVLHRPWSDPLVMQTDSETEFWQLRGSLNVQDGRGEPVDLPDNVRLYFNSSAAHSMRITGLRTNPPGSSALCANPTPGGTVIETARATLVAMDLWADRGILPPRSNYPRLENGTLIPLAEAGWRFPTIPGASFPTVQNQLDLLVFGPLFGQNGGVLSLQPPLLGPHYQQFVPRSDHDGLNIAGVRPMQVRVPLGTSSGWNIRRPEHRAPNLCGLTGSYFAFATTKAERLASGDPRKSLQERYRDHDGFVRAVEKAA